MEAAFRIVAESLTNIARHSQALTCSVRLARSDGDLWVAIRDDGGGIRQPTRDGVGLESMRRRASEIGTRISIEPADPHGTVVTALLPLGSP